MERELNEWEREWMMLEHGYSISKIQKCLLDAAFGADSVLLDRIGQGLPELKALVINWRNKKGYSQELRDLFNNNGKD